jgi:hypothetical protein
MQEKISEIHRENSLFDHWYAEWSTYYGTSYVSRRLTPDRLGVKEGDYLRDIREHRSLVIAHHSHYYQEPRNVRNSSDGLTPASPPTRACYMGSSPILNCRILNTSSE